MGKWVGGSSGPGRGGCGGDAFQEGKAGMSTASRHVGGQKGCWIRTEEREGQKGRARAGEEGELLRGLECPVEEVM